MLTILVAEDNRAERYLLGDVLKQAGHEVVLTETGTEALAAYQNQTFDMVLLDVMLGDTSGRDIAVAMRALQKEAFIPVVFITGLSMQEDIVECLKVGDDVIQKPFREEVLISKILALKRISGLYSELKEQKDQIAFHQNELMREQEFAKKIYDRITHHGVLDSEFIRYYASPQAFFNGDVILAAYHPLGGLMFFIGDFTGHGLPAALGALPLSDIFYSMTRRGHTVEQILREMNQKLRSILPSEIFCAAMLIYIDEKEKYMHVWNGGLPPGRIRYLDKKEDKLISSKHLPLGILEDNKFNADPEYIEIEKGDHIFLFSDGVYDAYGDETTGNVQRLVNQIFEKEQCAEAIFGTIIKTILTDKGMDQRDDITLVDITVAPFTSETEDPLLSLKRVKDKIDWRLSVILGPSSLRYFDPLPILLQLINEVSPLRSHASRIYTVLSEMYSNAVDHGVLKLDSRIKDSAAGFHEYYEQRKKALLDLKEGQIEIELSFFDEEEARFLRILIRDSGSGFKQAEPKPNKERAYCGRGIPLLRTLCHAVSYQDDGKTCEAIYRWR